MDQVNAPSTLANIVYRGKDKYYNTPVPFFRKLSLPDIRRKIPEAISGSGYIGAQEAFGLAQKRVRVEFGLPDNFFQGRGSIEGSLNKIHNAAQFDTADKKFKGADFFRRSLIEEGFEFQDFIPADRRLDTWLLTNKETILPLEDTIGTVSSLVYTDPNLASRYGDLQLNWDTRKRNIDSQTLFLDKHPAQMQIVEAILGRSFARRDRRPIFDSFSGSTNFLTDAGQKVLTEEVRSALRGLGYKQVSYLVGEKKGGVKTVDLGKAYYPQTVGELKRAYDKLDSALATSEKPPEGAAALTTDEIIKSNDAVFDASINSLEGDFYNYLFADIKSELPKNLRKDILGNLERAYKTAKENLGKTDLGSSEYSKLFEKKQHLQKDIEQVHRIVKVVRAGGLAPYYNEVFKNLPGFQSLTEFQIHSGREMLNLFKSQDDYIYEAFGGRNVETNYHTMYNTILVNSLGRVKEVGGHPLLKRLFSGEMDEGILKINYARRKLSQEKGGVAGKTGEEIRNLGLPEEYYKVEEILRDGMRMSQRFLTDTGFRRGEIPLYLGRRGIDPRKVAAASYEQFAKDLEGVNISEQGLKELHTNLSDTTTKIYDDYRGIDDVSEAFEQHRTIKFETAEAEHAFMQKYGYAAIGPKENLGRMLGVSGSNIMNGFMQSAQGDSSLAAVTSVFGTRPHMALDVAAGVLTKKREDAVAAGLLTAEQNKRLGPKISRSTGMAKSLINDWLFGHRVGVGTWARGIGALRSLVNAHILKNVSMWSIFSDPIKAGMQLEKIFRTKNNIGNFERTLGWAKAYGRNLARVWGPDGILGSITGKGKKEETAAMMNVALYADTRDFLSRYEMNAPGVASWLETLTYRAGFAPTINDHSRTSVLYLAGVGMEHRLRLPLSAQNRPFQNLIRTYGITPEIWKLVGEMPEAFAEVGGTKMLSMMHLRGALMERFTPLRANEIANMFDSFFQDVVNRSVVESSKFSQAFFFQGGQNPEGIMDNVTKTFNQFKATPVEEMFALAAGVKDLEMRGVRKPMYASWWTANLMAIMMAKGMAHGAARDVLAGKTVYQPDWEDADQVSQYLMRALTLGGGLGLAGDFLFGNATSGQFGLLNFFTGPTIQTAGTLLQAWRDLPTLLYDPEQFFGSAVKAARAVTPSFGPIQPMLLNMFFLDTLGDLADWNKSKEAVQRTEARMAARGQEYLVQ